MVVDSVSGSGQVYRSSPTTIIAQKEVDFKKNTCLEENPGYCEKPGFSKKPGFLYALLSAAQRISE
jgi:hypothetical protein